MMGGALGPDIPSWFGLLPVLTGTVLLLGFVGAICRAGKSRAWWIGFSLAGSAYLALAYAEGAHSIELPTRKLADLIGTESTHLSRDGRPRLFGQPLADYWKVGHSLASLCLAIAGGLAARAFWSDPSAAAPTGGPATRPAHDGQGSLRALLALAGCSMITLMLAATPVATTGSTVSTVLLLTSGLLAVAVLGAVCAKGKAREIWLGVSVAGGGYLLLAFAGPLHTNLALSLPTEHFLNRFSPSHHPTWPDPLNNDARIRSTLETPLDLRFPNETPIEDLLKYIQDATRAPDGWEIPIYVDSLYGLQEAEKTMLSPVQIDVSGVPLKTTLALALRQLGLEYRVEGGVVRITSETADIPAPADAFLVVGHCILAVVFAAAGGVLAPIVSACAEE